MNIIDLQEDLKDFPDKRLMDEMQRPTGSAPQFLVLSELQRRKRMRDDFKRQEASNMPTVAEEMIAGAGVPQEGLTAIAGAMAPKTNVAQDTGLAQAMPMQATRAPQQPQMMSTGGITSIANLPEQIQAGRVSLVGGARPGVGFRSGTTTNAIASLKVNFPELYEQFKNDPRLEQVALASLERTIEPDESFSELGVRENPYAADPFKPTASMFKMDDSGTRGIDNRLGDSLKRFEQSFLADTFLNDTDPNSLMYAPAQPGQYKYQGTMFTLNPDGTMVSETGIPVGEEGKAAILAANLPKVPISNYGKKDELPVGAVEQDFASLIADDSDGTPVDPLDIYNLPQSIIDARKMSAPELNLTKDPTILGGFDDDMTASSITPSGISRVNAPTFDDTFQSPPLEYPEAIETIPDLSSVEEQQRQDAIRKYLAEGFMPGIADSQDRVNEGTLEDRYVRQQKKLLQQDIDSVDGDLSQLSPYGEMSAKALQYYQDDQYTPPEEIYAKANLVDDTNREASLDQPNQFPLFTSNTLPSELEQSAAPPATPGEYGLGIPDIIADLNPLQPEKNIGSDIVDLIPPEIQDQINTQIDAVKEIPGLVMDNAGVVGDVIKDTIERQKLRKQDKRADSYETGGNRYADYINEKANQDATNLKEDLDRSLKTGKSTSESALQKALASRQKARDQSFWLDVARAGAKMAQSKNPTLIGAAAEGIESFADSRSKASKQALDYKVAMAKINAAANKGTTLTLNQRVQALQKERKRLEDKLLLMGDDERIKFPLEKRIAAIDAAIAPYTGMPAMGTGGQPVKIS